MINVEICAFIFKPDNDLRAIPRSSEPTVMASSSNGLGIPMVPAHQPQEIRPASQTRRKAPREGWDGWMAGAKLAAGGGSGKIHGDEVHAWIRWAPLVQVMRSGLTMTMASHGRFLLGSVPSSRQAYAGSRRWRQCT